MATHLLDGIQFAPKDLEFLEDFSENDLSDDFFGISQYITDDDSVVYEVFTS